MFSTKDKRPEKKSEGQQPQYLQDYIAFLFGFAGDVKMSRNGRSGRIVIAEREVEKLGPSAFDSHYDAKAIKTKEDREGLKMMCDNLDFEKVNVIVLKQKTE